MTYAPVDLFESLTSGSARFDHSSWTLAIPSAMASDVERTTSHEHQHAALNGITLFGLALQVCAQRAVAGSATGQTLLRALISRCRKTHEVAATYLSSALPDGESAVDFADNFEYQSYFDLGRDFAARLPSFLLGLAAVSGLTRIAMNCPLPQQLIQGDFETLRPSDFRGEASPDARFARLFALFDAPFWEATAAAAAARFDHHPDWQRSFGNTENVFYGENVFKMTPLADGRVSMAPGGIDDAFANDVTNFLIDQMVFTARDASLYVPSLAERIEIERRVAARYELVYERPYTVSDPVDDWSDKRLRESEAVQFREKPAPTQVLSSADLLEDSQLWPAYEQIIRAEEYLPVYCRTQDDIGRNHDLDRDLPVAGNPVFFLRKQVQLDDGQIGLQIHVIETPQQLQRLSMVSQLAGGHVRVLIAGSALALGGVKMLEAWGLALQDTVFCVLLDCDPGAVMPLLNTEWEALAWQIHAFGYGGDWPVLFVYPVGLDWLAGVGFIKPGTQHALDATIKAFDPLPFPGLHAHLGGRIVGLSERAVEQSAKVPDQLVWGAARVLNEEYGFSMSKPEVANDP